MQINLIKIGLTYGIIGFCSFLLLKLNIDKNNRYKQENYPIITTLLAIILMVGIGYGMDVGARKIIIAEDYQNSEIFDANCLLMIGLALIKIFARINKFFNKRKEDLGWVGSRLYYYDIDDHEYFLNDDLVNVRTLFGQFSVVYYIACCALISLTWIKGSESGWWVYAYPTTLLAIIIECYNLLNVYTKKEFEHLISGSESHATRINDFMKLKEIYEKMFAPNLLSSYSGCQFSNSQSPKLLLDELEKSDADIDYITAQYFKVNSEKKKFDVDHIQASLNLMKKENVIFLNPFYRDLSDYLLLPIVYTLVSNKKVLVLSSRQSMKEDVQNWLTEILKNYAKVESAWTVGDISNQFEKYDVGILDFHRLYDLRTFEKNQEFFNKVGFVLVLEPSLVVNTGQIGFQILSNSINLNEMDSVYCVVDRMSDGLVDTMSHLLQTKFTEVIAPPVPRFMHTSMSWDADGDYMREVLLDKQTRYLGSGMELAAVAIKNQIPEVTWVSESKSPIKDIRWIIGQYYSTLCNYMHLKTNQQAIYDKIKFVPNLWQLTRKDEQFIITDDEFSNMFLMMRMYLSRGNEQVFLNVMSENYLLRDYMRCNPDIFNTNPNSIPSIVPDFARTERNTLIKILFTMCYREMTDGEIRHEFDMLDMKDDEDVTKILQDLVDKYFDTNEHIFKVSNSDQISEFGESFTELRFSVNKGNFTKELTKALSNAYYIVEDEKTGTDYLDAKLYSHVAQTVLPGEYVVYDGKYYKVKSISLKNGVILRRASNLFNGKKYYRQIRKYHVDGLDTASIVEEHNYNDIKTTLLNANFSVDTSGYLEMPRNNDLRNAKEIFFEQPNQLEDLRREYIHKNILRIKLPESDYNLRYTICLLLTELFKTIYPNTYHYLAVTTKYPEDIKGMLSYVVYGLDGDIDEDYIYVFEDSDIDLGLLESVDKNFNRFMEILTDFTEWHFEKMRENGSKDKMPEQIELPDDIKLRKEKIKKQNLFGRMLRRIQQLLGHKKEEEIQVVDEPVTTEPVKKEEPQEVKQEAPQATPEVLDNSDQSTYEVTPEVEKPKKQGWLARRKAKKEAKKKAQEEAKRIAEEEKAKEEEAKKKEQEEAEKQEKIEARERDWLEEAETLKAKLAEEGKTDEEIEEILVQEKEKYMQEHPIEGVDDQVPEESPAEDSNPEEEQPQEESSDTEETEDESEEAEEVAEDSVKPDLKVATSVSGQTTSNEDSQQDETEESEPVDFDDSLDENDHDIVDIDGTNIFDEGRDPEIEEYLDLQFTTLGLNNHEPTRYQKECFLKYGFNEIDSRIKLKEMNQYLTSRGFSDNNLNKARNRSKIDLNTLDEAWAKREAALIAEAKEKGWPVEYLAKRIAEEKAAFYSKYSLISDYYFQTGVQNTCDFCGKPISGVSYERLDDGRIRCRDCSASAVNTVEEFTEIFNHIITTMGTYYGIQFNKMIAIEMTDANTIAKGAGYVFKPSTQFAARALGYAQHYKGAYRVFIENGSPRLAAIKTMVHELTHIWQYLNWNDARIIEMYGNERNRLCVYEGMAEWAAIQYLYLIGETAEAVQQEYHTASRDDEYGIGFRAYRARYPFVKNGADVKYSPFNVYPPL